MNACKHVCEEKKLTVMDYLCRKLHEGTKNIHLKPDPFILEAFNIFMTMKLNNVLYSMAVVLPVFPLWSHTWSLHRSLMSASLISLVYFSLWHQSPRRASHATLLGNTLLTPMLQMIPKLRLTRIQLHPWPMRRFCLLHSLGYSLATCIIQRSQTSYFQQWISLIPLRSIDSV